LVAAKRQKNDFSMNISYRAREVAFGGCSTKPLSSAVPQVLSLRTKKLTKVAILQALRVVPPRMSKFALRRQWRSLELSS
jgi:hypothetical protein